MTDTSGRTVYLHAGLPKTGSSSIQAALYAGRAVLSAANIHYWSVADNHTWPLTLMFGEERGDESIRNAAFKRKKFGTPEEIRRSLHDELSGPWEKFVVSAERISSLTRPQLEELKALVGGYADRITAVGYIREPRGWISSIVQQRLKVGATIAESLDQFATLPYRARMEPLIDVLGRENVMFRRYRTDWGSGGIHGDFLQAIDAAPDIAAQISEVRTNSSFSAEAASVLDQVNSEIRRQQLTFRTGLNCSPHIEGLFKGAKFTLGDDVMEDVIAKNKDQIAWASEMLGEEIDRPSTSASMENTYVVPDDIARLIVKLLSALANKKDIELKRTVRDGLIKRRRENKRDERRASRLEKAGE